MEYTPVVTKTQDEYLVSLSGGKQVLMYVQLHHTQNEKVPVRVTLSRPPLGQGGKIDKTPKDYHFEESTPEVIEAVALAMLEAVKLARAVKL